MTGVTYASRQIDDPELLKTLPEYLVAMLRETNGFIHFDGGLHLRGACLSPAWHSIRAASEGALSFHTLYQDVQPEDIPFAEDCMGDQFLLRRGSVHRLASETGGVEDLAMTLPAFFRRAEADPVEFLQMHPLLQFQAEGGRLTPGQLLAAYPPFFIQEASQGVTLRAISTEDRRSFLADMAKQVRDVPDGATVQFEVVRGTRSRPTMR